MENNSENKLSDELENTSDSNLDITSPNALEDTNSEGNLNNNFEEDNLVQYKGLGGWLILPIIGLFQNVLFSPFTILRTITPIFQGYTSIRGNYPLLMFTAILEIAFRICFWVYTVIILILLFQKKKVVPKLFIGMYASAFIFQVIDFILLKIIEINSGIVHVTLSYVIPLAIPALIWISYFHKSERVKNTFTN